DAPTVVRYPKGALGAPIPALRRDQGFDILAEHGTGRDAVVLGLGPMAATAIEVAGKLAAEGFGTVAATATWVHPVPEGLAELIAGARVVITIEDGLVDAGIGE